MSIDVFIWPVNSLKDLNSCLLLLHMLCITWRLVFIVSFFLDKFWILFNCDFIADEQEAATVEGTQKEAASSYKTQRWRSWYGQILVVSWLIPLLGKKEGAALHGAGISVWTPWIVPTTSKAFCESSESRVP